MNSFSVQKFLFIVVSVVAFVLVVIITSLSVSCITDNKTAVLIG